jgi:hypothetical protein
MTEMLVPLVGMYWRPPAQLIVDNLPGGSNLILDPEPNNDKDPNAIRVMVRTEDLDFSKEIEQEIRDKLIGYGVTWDDFKGQEFAHLGYIAASGGKFCKIDDEPSKGNAEVLEVLQGVSDWRASLTFSPHSKPLVKVTY